MCLDYSVTSFQCLAPALADDGQHYSHSWFLVYVGDLQIYAQAKMEVSFSIDTRIWITHQKNQMIDSKLS